MARIENYGNDALVTIDDKVIGTDAVDNSTKNFRVGDIVALAGGGGTTYTAGAGISITNGVISSTIVDTDTNNYISNVALNGTSLDFTGTAPAFNGSVSLGAIADQTVVLTGAGGVTITGTYPNFTIDGSSIAGGGGTTYTAGAGISITNGVISSTIVDTDTNNYISNVALNGTSLDFTGTAPAFNGSVALGAIADQTVTIAGTNGIAVTGTYPNFSISGAGVVGGYDWSLFADTGDLDPVVSGSQITFAGGTNVTTSFANNTLTINATGISGTGVLNNVPKWTGASTLGSSLIIDDGNGVAVGVQPPAARFHVHNGGASNSILKLTHSANTGVQDGMDITLSSIAGQMWLYEPLPLRFATNNAERFSIDGAGQGWFKYGLRISAGIVDSNTTKGTAGQILSSTGTDIAWINAPSGASTLSALTDTTIANPSAGQYLVYNGSAWINAEFRPAEKLILQIINGYTLASNQSADLVFTAVTGNLNTGGLHISQSNLADLGVAGAGFEVLNTDCKAKISIGAFIDATSNNEVLTFTLTERDPNGITALKGRAQFDYFRAGTHASSFFSNFELLAGHTYLFSASLTNTSNGVTILQPTQIEIEIIG